MLSFHSSNFNTKSRKKYTLVSEERTNHFHRLLTKTLSKSFNLRGLQFSQMQNKGVGLGLPCGSSKPLIYSFVNPVLENPYPRHYPRHQVKAIKR